MSENKTGQCAYAGLDEQAILLGALFDQWHAASQSLDRHMSAGNYELAVTRHMRFDAWLEGFLNYARLSGHTEVYETTLFLFLVWTYRS